MCALLTASAVCSAESPVAIYVQYDFDSDTAGEPPSGISVYTKGDYNRIEVASHTVEDGNYLLIEKDGTEGDPYVDIAFPAYYYSSDSILHFSFYTEDTDSEKVVTVKTDRTTGAFSEIIRMTSNGVLKAGGTEIGTYPTGRWSWVDVVIKANGTMDVYIENKLVRADVTYKSWSSAEVKYLRLQMEAGKTGSICFDDVCIYPGNEVKYATALQSTSVLMVTPEQQVESYLTHAVAMRTGSTAAYASGTKTVADHVPVEIDGIWYVPARWTVLGLGGSYTQTDEDGTMSIGINGKTAVYTIGKRVAVVDGNTVSLSNAPQIIDECYMLPVTELTDRLTSCTLSYGSKFGVLILDAAMQELTDSQIKDIFDYLTYTRPKADQILVDFSPMQNVHPRIMATADTFAEIREKINTDAQMRTWYSSVISSAESMLSAEHTYYYKPDGLRLLDMSRQLLKRAYTLGMAWQITGDNRYADYLWGELEAVCNFDDWNSAKHFLDTAEMTNGVAIAYDWCYDYWTEEQREFIENAIMELGLKPGRRCYSKDSELNSSWILWSNNWNQVCNGGLTVGALALMDKEPEFCSQLMELAFLSMESMIGEFSPDGAWAEGVSYWSYCVYYFVYQMSAMDTALNTNYGYFDCTGVDQTAYFMTYAQSSQGSFNFHDAGSGSICDPTVFYFSDKLNDGGMAQVHINEMREYSASASALDLLWYNPDLMKVDLKLPLDRMFRDTEMATFRSAFGDSEALFAGIHGGDNNINHGNLDSGTFVLDALGVRWASDLGSDDYNLNGYFDNSGGKRWNYYRCNAQGQNVIALNPVTEHGQEPLGFTTIKQFVSESRGGYAVIDMAPAYGDKVSYARRGMKVDNNRSQVVLQDELSLTEETDLWWFMHTTADIAVSEDGKSVVLTESGKQMYVALETNQTDAVFEVIAAEPLEGSANPDGQASNDSYQKLTIHLPEAIGPVTISVRFVPIFGGVTLSSIEANGLEPMTEIEKWQIESGNIAALSGISVNGNQLSNFVSNQYSYTESFPNGTKETPVVTATANDDMTVEIVQAASANGTAQIAVYETADPNNICYYTLKFSVRTASNETFSEDFESYVDIDDFETKNLPYGTPWYSEQVIGKAGPHSIESGIGYDGAETQYFRILLTPDTAVGADPSLVTKAIDFTEPMELHFDVMAESIDEEIQVVFREGSKPNWIFPLDKEAGSAKVQIFGLTLPDFTMETNQWYRFDYEISFDKNSGQLTFSVWLNGDNVFKDQILLCNSSVTFESVMVKFIHLMGNDGIAENAAVNWDNILIQKKEFVHYNSVLLKNGAEMSETDVLQAGDTVSFQMNASYHGSEKAVMVLARYGRNGTLLKQVNVLQLTADEINHGPVSVSIVLDDAPGSGEVWKGFLWNETELIPFKEAFVYTMK